MRDWLEWHVQGVFFSLIKVGNACSAPRSLTYRPHSLCGTLESYTHCIFFCLACDKPGNCQTPKYVAKGGTLMSHFSCLDTYTTPVYSLFASSFVSCSATMQYILVYLLLGCVVELLLWNGPQMLINCYPIPMGATFSSSEGIIR